MPPRSLAFIFQEFEGRGHKVARHRFGCRVLERIIEHCPETQGQTASLFDDLEADAEALCRHPYGNFVVQHLMEHGTPERKSRLVASLLDQMPAFAKHRTASHFVQRALEHGGDDVRNKIVWALLEAEGENSLEEVACSRGGSFVAEQLADVFSSSSAEVARRFLDAMPALEESPFGMRVLARFGLLPDQDCSALPVDFAECRRMPSENSVD